MFVCLSAAAIQYTTRLDLVHGATAQDLYCRLWITFYPMWSFITDSTYNLTVISLERYAAIRNPLTYNGTQF